jgi:hypothetical protein
MLPDEEKWSSLAYDRMGRIQDHLRSALRGMLMACMVPTKFGVDMPTLTIAVRLRK